MCKYDGSKFDSWGEFEFDGIIEATSIIWVDITILGDGHDLKGKGKGKKISSWPSPKFNFSLFSMLKPNSYRIRPL